MDTERFNEFDKICRELGIKIGKSDELWDNGNHTRGLMKRVLQLLPKHQQGRSLGPVLPMDLVQQTLATRVGGVKLVDVARSFGVTPSTIYNWRKGRRPTPERHRSSFQALAVRSGNTDLIEKWDAIRAGATSDHMTHEMRDLAKKTLKACAHRRGFGEGGVVSKNEVLGVLGVNVGRYWNIRYNKASVLKSEAPKFLKLAQMLKDRQLTAAWLDVIDEI